MKKKINVGVADAVTSAKDFIDAWKRTESEKSIETENKIHFQSLEMLLKTLTSTRWMLLKTLSKSGPMSIRALASESGRDYKNVHTDVRKLENAGLISRTEDNKIEVPWDIVEARLRLAA